MSILPLPNTKTKTACPTDKLLTKELSQKGGLLKAEDKKPLACQEHMHQRLPALIDHSAMPDRKLKKITAGGKRRAIDSGIQALSTKSENRLEQTPMNVQSAPGCIVEQRHEQHSKHQDAPETCRSTSGVISISNESEDQDKDQDIGKIKDEDGDEDENITSETSENRCGMPEVKLPCRALTADAPHPIEPNVKNSEHMRSTSKKTTNRLNDTCRGTRRDPSLNAASKGLPASVSTCAQKKKRNNPRPTSVTLNKNNKQGLSDLNSRQTRPASVPQPMVYYARDIRGRRHDIKKLRVRRNKAVLKGMRFMRRFLRRQKYKALYEIGDDAPSIFFEIWYTSADSRIRAEAKVTARELLKKLERKMERDCGKFGVPDRDEFFALMFLARIRHELGDENELNALLKRADTAWRRNGYQDNTDHLFDYQLRNLGSVDTDAWLGLLMRILIMEYNNLLFPRRYPLEWGMHEALQAIKELKLDGPGGDDFHHSFFLATHIIYALGAYSAIKTREQDCPWLYKYLRVSMRFWMREAWKRKRIENLIAAERERGLIISSYSGSEEEQGQSIEEDSDETKTEDEDSDETKTEEEENNYAKAKQHTDDDYIPVAKRFPQVLPVNPVRKGRSPRQTHEWVYVDVDGVSEIIDTFRGCGLTSASDRLVCEGSLFLLETQRKDGSWPYWNKEGDGSKDPDCNSYDLLHPTWVAVQGLRDRDFKLDRPAAEKWRKWINKIVADVGFADDPTYENNWMCKQRYRKKLSTKKKKKKKKKKKLERRRKREKEKN